MKLKSYYYLLFCAIFFNSSCKEVDLPKKVRFKISFDVESEKFYDISDFHTTKFSFSPLDSNVVWFVENGKIRSFDLESGTDLGSPPFPSDKIFNSKIIIDEENNIAWFTKGKLYKFDLTSRIGNSINIPQSDTLFITEKYLVVFDYGSYYKLDRKGKLLSARRIKINDQITSVCKINDSEFLLNDEFIFSIETDSLYIGNSFHCFQEEKSIQPFARHLIEHRFPSSDDRYQFFYEENYFWGINERGIYFLNDDSLSVYKNFEQLQDFQIDEKYFYLLTNRGFTILNKKYAVENLFKKIDVGTQNLARDFQKEYKDFRKELWENGKWITDENNVDSFFYYNEVLRQKYQKSNNPKILKELKELKQNNLSLNYSYDDQLTGIIEKAINSNKVPDHFLLGAYEGVIKNKVRKGQFAVGGKWANKWNALNFEDGDSIRLKYFNKEILRLNSFLTQKRKLKNENLPIDIELKKEIDLTEKYISSNNWFESGIEYDYTVVKTLIDSFLIAFPRSSVIEDIAYKKMNFDLFIDGCTPSFTPENIPIYKKFILDFPNSKNTPNAIYRMYCEYVDMDIGSREEIADTLKNVYRKLDSFFKMNPTYRDTFGSCLKELKESELSAIWELKLEPVKPYYKEEDAIEVYVSMENKTDKPQTLVFFKDEGYPYFSITDFSYLFQKKQNSDSTTIEIIVAPHEVYREKIDLEKKIRHRKGLGQFDITKPGSIGLRASYYDKNHASLLRSRYMKISVTR